MADMNDNKQSSDKPTLTPEGRIVGDLKPLLDRLKKINPKEKPEGNNFSNKRYL